MSSMQSNFLGQLMRYWHIYDVGQGQGHLISKVMMSHETVQTFLSLYVAIIG